MIDRLLLTSILALPALAAQPSAPSPISAPLRDLTWGQLNFLHTTDTHGWHAGHLQEPSYSADWGDYISFATRMLEKAEAAGTDLLIIDTGDRVEGNGLYDASDPKGEYTFNIFKEQHIDVICSGNHELYKKNSSENEYLKTVPNFQGNYLASNLDIIDPETEKIVPLAPRFKKFTTNKQGIRILAFGFLFDFTGNYNNTIVQPVEQTIKEKWFQEAIRDREVDLFLVTGHVPLRSREFECIFKEIRAVQWDTPIQFFGGHTHIRDYTKFDSKSYALESGRFMETIGFLSIDGLNTGAKPDPKITASTKFERKYIDNNLFSFHHHTGLNKTTFPTSHGQNVSKMIKDARKSLNLDNTYGCASQNLWMTRAKYPSNESIYTWLEETVLPDVVEDKDRADKPRLVILNTGGIRFDIFKGPFTKDTTYIVSPFTGGFRYVRDLPYAQAKKLLPILNNNGQLLDQAAPKLSKISTLAPPEQKSVLKDIIVPPQAGEMPQHSDQIPLGKLDDPKPKPNLTPGYTTTDDAGSDGDDTLHSPLSFYRVPNCIQSFIVPFSDKFSARTPSSSISISDDDSSPPEDKEPETVDLVYITFIEPWILTAAKFAGLDFEQGDTAEYMPGKVLTELIAGWVRGHWKGDC